MRGLQLYLIFAFLSMVTSRITIDQEPSDCGQNKEKRRETFSFPFSSGSVDTDISNYPWTASILKYDGRRPKIHCGGSLISTRHILTASHCVHEEKKEDLKVILRATDPFKDGKVFDVQEYLKHPNFISPKAYFDLAIIQLKKNVVFTFNIFPVCLPKKANIDVNKWKDLPATMSGYGSKTGDNSPAKLHYSPLTILKQQDCTKRYYDDLKASNSEESEELRGKVKSFLSREKITNELICSLAATEELGTCPGDSGGPLVHYNQEDFLNFQVGVVYGSLMECDDRKYPSLYGRVDDYHNLNFIRETAFGDIIDKPDGTNVCQESNHCQNEGECENTRSGSGYICKCKLFEKGALSGYPAFTGINCEIPVVCIGTKNPCKHNAKCYVESTDLYNSKCKCKAGAICDEEGVHPIASNCPAYPGAAEATSHIGVKGCGYSRSKGLNSGRLNSTSTPWTASILLRTRLHCSGSILNDKFVLTAAHCFTNLNQSEMTVIVGAAEPTNPEYLKSKRRLIQQKKISNVKTHPLWVLPQFADHTTVEYDLALVEIKGRFRFTPSIMPTCIPGKALPREYNFHKDYALLGYGTKSEDSALNSKQLNVQYTELCSAVYGPILTDPTNPFHKTIQRALPNNFDDDSLICGLGDPSCRGDSGGMLVKKVFSLEFGSQAVQQAVLHGSLRSCGSSEQQYPMIFVRLDNAKVLSWILENVNFDGEIDECIRDPSSCSF